MPISQELLEILVCPETKQPVAIADDALIARINADIEAGRLRNRGGDAVSEPIVHRSEHSMGNALWVRLIDEIGNSAGLGATIVIRSGAGPGARQRREIRQSGGFASFDPPEAHFGLGKAEEVDEIVVTWRDGARTRIDGPIPANAELVVRRSAR